MPYAERTEVPVARTRAEIERLLEGAKAKQYGTAVDYDQCKARVQFRLHDRIVRFVITLPDRKRLSGPRVEREERQRWRALLLVIKAKLESVASQIETFDSAFLAQIVLPNEQTVAEAVAPALVESYASGRMPRGLLGAGDSDHDVISR
jgi:hypothetical protein